MVAVGNDLSKLNSAACNQLADENLGLGDATWKYPAEMEEELDPKPFYEAARLLCGLYTENGERFPSGDLGYGNHTLIKFLATISVQ